MKVAELITFLKEVDPTAEVQLQDLNGLYWELDFNSIFVDDHDNGAVIFSTKGINEV